MAIYRVSGQMLQSTLVRDGNNIAFANTANSTSTLFVDIANGRVGVNSNVANVTLDVYGNIFALNLSSTGNITSANINATQISATANITGGNILTAGLISATGNATVGNVSTVYISASGNINTSADINQTGTGNINGYNGYFANNLTVVGTFTSTSNIVANTSGIFYGNSVTGNGAIYGGVPSYTPLASNVVIQFAGNANSYSQVNFQNINPGTQASTDYIATANNGDDSTYFLDMGIGGNAHADPDFFGDSTTVNDAYLYVVGADATGPGSAGPGNLIIGSTNGNIKMFVGNTAQANVVQTVANTGVYVTGVISASGNVTGDILKTGSIVIPSSGNITIANVNINNLAEPFANSDAATKFYVDTTTDLSWGNLYVSNTTITSSLANGNITLLATGTELVQVGGTAGFIIPVGNIDQRPSPAETGTIRFNTVNTTLEIWDGSSWVSATSDISVITNQTLNGDGSTTVFSLNQAATAESILVSINGIVQTPGVDYSTGTGPDEITFTTAPAGGDVVQVRFITTTTTVSALYNGTSNINIPVSNGNAVISIGGTSNVVTITNTGANISGYANITGNLTANNLSLVGNISSANITGNVIANNITAGYAVYTNGMVNIGANGTGNIGSSTTTFDTVFAKATSAQYADLAEFYSADADYTPGTVLRFGGNFEVTVCNEDSDPCVAGVVSTNPSYIMNAGIVAEHPTQVALTGRVPCCVVGPVTKGAMMVSAGNGRARAEKTPAMGTVIGKALEAFTGTEGTIEIVVGRL